MIVIDNTTYNIGVKSIKRTAEFLDKYATRNEAGDLMRKLVGVYYNYEIEFAATNSTADYAALWDKLTEPTEFHTVKVPSDTGWYTFAAYITGVSDDFRKVGTGGQSYSQALKAQFIAKSPARS